MAMLSIHVSCRVSQQDIDNLLYRIILIPTKCCFAFMDGHDKRKPNYININIEKAQNIPFKLPSIQTILLKNNSAGFINFFVHILGTQYRQ